MGNSIKELIYRTGKVDNDIERLTRHLDDIVLAAKEFTKENAVNWAGIMMRNPNSVLLIVETTKIVQEDDEYPHHPSQYTYAIEPIRVTGMHVKSCRHFDYKLSPTFTKRITDTEHHGLTSDDLRGKPSTLDIWYDMYDELVGNELIVFGLDHAIEAMDRVIPSSVMKDSSHCLHAYCQQYYSQFYDLSLETVLSYQEIFKRRVELKDSVERIGYLRRVLENISLSTPMYCVPSNDSVTSHGSGTAISHGLGAAPAWSSPDDFDDDSGDADDLDEHPF